MKTSSNILGAIHGVVRAKKNSRQLFVRNGKLVNIPSYGYAEWHDGAISQLLGVPAAAEYPVRLDCRFWFNSRHKKDLDNLLTSVLDILQDAGIIENDDYTHVGHVSATFAGYDKEDPRVEFHISPLV